MASCTVTQMDNGAHTAAARRIMEHVEATAVGLEDRFGRARLLETVDGVTPEEFSGHVENYRLLIRQSWWPHDDNGDTLTTSSFLEGFGRGAAQYLGAGIAAWAWRSDPSIATLATIHRQALAAEATRGQDGKSSPCGLDARLERLESELLESLDGDESALILIGSLGFQDFGAETALLRDFRSLRSIFPEPPSREQVLLSTGPAQQAVWHMLRRHHRWSVRALTATYRELEAIDIDHACIAIDAGRRTLQADRENVLESLSGEQLKLADALYALNYLNLVLEPAYGFKGGAGLGLGCVFREAQRLVPLRDPWQRQAWLEKTEFQRGHKGEP